MANSTLCRVGPDALVPWLGRSELYQTNCWSTRDPNRLWSTLWVFFQSFLQAQCRQSFTMTQPTKRPWFHPQCAGSVSYICKICMLKAEIIYITEQHPRHCRRAVSAEAHSTVDLISLQTKLLQPGPIADGSRNHPPNGQRLVNTVKKSCVGWLPPIASWFLSFLFNSFSLSLSLWLSSALAITQHILITYALAFVCLC